MNTNPNKDANMDTTKPGPKTLPVAGTPATVRIGSDRYAAQIVAVSKTGAKIVVEYTTDGHKGERVVFHRNGRGLYQAGAYRLAIGEAVDYRDPSF